MRSTTFNDNQVVLLLGVPNSGATDIAGIFRAHPDVIVGQEPATTDLDATVPMLCTGSDVDRYRPIASSYLSRLAQRANANVPPDSRDSGTSDDIALSRQPATGGSFPIGMKSRASGLRRLFGRGAPSRDQASMPATGNTKRIVIESADHLGRISLFTAAMPGIHVILTVRNPFGHAAAALRTAGRNNLAPPPTIGVWLETPQAKSYGLSRPRLAAMSPIEQLTWDWAIRNELAIDALAKTPRSCVVRRRDVVVNPVKTARHLYACADLLWDPEAFIRNREAWDHSAEDDHGEDWPDRYPATGGMAELCLRAFDSVPTSLYGGTVHRYPAFGAHRFGWETALEPYHRRQILNVVQSTSLASRFPELRCWANLD